MGSFPRFETLLKSRDVEDPVNLWLHRPLAYLFARAVYRTPMTPNQVTLLAMFVGVAAAEFAEQIPFAGTRKSNGGREESQPENRNHNRYSVTRDKPPFGDEKDCVNRAPMSDSVRSL